MNARCLFRVIAAAVVMMICFSVCSAEKTLDLPIRFDNIIESVCVLYPNLSPSVVKALIYRESRFNPCARGKAGEIGLMQIKRSVIEDWAKAHSLAAVPTAEEAMDPYLNIMIGTWHLSRALDHWKGRSTSLSLALFEYNAGRTCLVTWIAHFGGDTKAAIAHGPSSAYIRDIRVCASKIRFSASSSLPVAKLP